MDFQIIIQLILATFLGALIGLEREYKKKEAGLRTYSLVSLGAAFFTIISYTAFESFADQAGIDFDPTRIIGQIVLGIGFLGAGLIIFRGFHIEGLTTAAGLWVAAAIGVAVGTKLYFPAIFATFLVIGILSGLRIFEEKFFEKSGSG
jgi:putative Mg2+ transporter-C (MgtC) family protein